jgi:polysaccharide biosynthesis/export protein
LETDVRSLTAFRIATGLGALLASVGLGASSARAQTAASSRPAAGASQYLIGPADVLQIIVWKEPELSRPVTVRFDGMVTVPLIGDVVASGRTTTQLAETLSQGLKRFIEVPRVTVGVEQANSARFYVVGQVGKSGEFPLSGPTTVLQALALAGGFKDFAKTDDIVIVRRDQTVVPVNYKRIADGKDVAQNVLLSPGDTIVVP